MKKIPVLLLISVALTVFFLSTLWAQASEMQPARSDKKYTQTNLSSPLASLPLQSLFTSRTSDSGLLNTSHQMVFGPLSCTSRGDPYSPFNSPFRPPGYPAGSYVYHYRLLIPPSYPDNMLRVELFDPDTHNESINSATVIHTTYAVNNGFPAAESMDCSSHGQASGSSARYNVCLLESGEASLISPAVTVDQINPVWFLRVDENRPAGCGSASNYNPADNTTTVYQLYYQRQNTDGTVERVQLSSYTGRPDNAHQTDLYWVSPGAPPSFDYPGLPDIVPADVGSPKTFQLDLTRDVPDILVEQGTGNRIIYLSVATIGGSSKNGFDIWAGPNDYINSVPSEVNGRNIHILDAPGSHDSGGVVILANEAMPQAVHSNQVVARPLAYLGPEYAGQTISLTMFDIDTGSQAPVTFTLDTIDPADWSVTFAISGTIDPDGVPANGRCFPLCNNQFISPTYAITLPGGSNCTPPTCTPFTGGRLLMHYLSGLNDNHLVSLSAPLPSVTISGPVTGTLGTSNMPTFIAQADFISTTLPLTYTWQATAQLPVMHTNGLSDTATFSWLVPYTYTLSVTATNGVVTATDSHQIVIYPAPPIPGCASFPIGIQADVRSVYPPLSQLPNNNPNPFPAPGDFHPSSPTPLYIQFPNNIPDTPLSNAQEGHVFKLNNGLGSGSMAWLVWNKGISPSSSTLADSLTVPGNSTNYINAGNGSITPIYPYMVRGYVNPFDSLDLIMQPNDWVTINTGSVNSNAVRNVINTNIEQGFELPVIIWDSSQAQSGYTYVHMVQFAVFRLHGHNLSQGGGPSWLLAEFVRWETGVCTVGQYPIGQVDVSGPLIGTTSVDYDFTATVVPTMTNQPITYTWQATEQTPLTSMVGVTDTITFNWSTGGTKLITVTAENMFGTVTAVHTITLVAPIPLTSVTLTGPFNGAANLDYAFTATVVPTMTNQPITYAWQASEQATITQTNGISDTAVFNWLTPGPKTITVTASNSLSTVTATHLITISQPIINVSLTGAITGMTGISYDFTAVINPLTANQPITYTWQASEQATITQTNGITDTAVFNWLTPGPKTITVTASNSLGTVTATHLITLNQPLPDLAVGQPQLVTPTPIAAFSPVTFQLVITNLSSIDIASLFFIDIYLDPEIVLSTTIPGPSDGFTAVSALPGQTSRIITITAQLGFANEPNPHLVFAVVDSLEAIEESNETNNVSPPLVVTDVITLPEPITDLSLTGPITGLIDTGYSFTAVITPPNAAQPITYTWQATDQLPLVHTGSLTDIVTFTWGIAGTKTITVTAANGVGEPVTAVHTITITSPPSLWHLYLPFSVKSQP